jgi:hypothetical protein
MKRTVRRVLSDVTPPILWRVIAAPGRNGRAYVPLRAELPEVSPRALNYLLDDPVMVVPIERVRYPYATKFTYAEHHFLRYFADGAAALRRFYEVHQPRNVFEKYHLPAPQGVAAPKSGWPWFKRGRVHRGEAGLGPEHGLQGHGPVSAAKLELEARRLSAVLRSIERLGFRPDMGGYPQGYFMLRTAGDWVFTVRGGVHRTAALAHLGHRTLEVRFMPSYPRIVDERDVAEWPMVREGELSPEAALAIFGQFFQAQIPYPGA